MAKILPWLDLFSGRAETGYKSWFFQPQMDYGGPFFYHLYFFEGILHHKIPGFYNFLAVNPVRLSQYSVPYHMWFNFDRTFSAMILWMCAVGSSGAVQSEKKPQNFENPKKFKITGLLRIFLACVGVISVLSLASGYIQWDIKWPSIIGIWCLNNLFFVCFPEEVFFRGFLQAQIKAQMPTKWHCYFPHIAISSIFFGIDHALKGGIVYGFLALIAGGFYGYVYDTTQRLEQVMLFHFLVNLVHLIFFTYPASLIILR